MDGARNQLLARARLAENADARLARRHALHLRHHTLHGFAFPNDLVLANALAQVPVLVLQALDLQDVLDGQQQLVGGKRFLEKPLSTEDRKSTRLNSSHEWISYA